MTKKQIKEQLYLLEEKDKVQYEVGHRGGYYGLIREDACILLDINDQPIDYFPPKIGVYCSYLGGGLRGAVAASGYDQRVPEDVAKKIDMFCEVCKERYLEIEKEYVEDDEWNKEGTRLSREAGVVNAY